MDPLWISIRAPLLRTDLPGLYRRVCRLLEHTGATVAMCDVGGVRADAVAVDALARLELGARRHGAHVRLVSASPELLALIEFVGLAEVF